MRLALRTYTAVLLLALVLPMLVVVPLSFSAGATLKLPVPGWSGRWYHDLFTDAGWRMAARNSIEVAVATTLLATLLGTAAALGLALGRFRGKAVLLGLLTAPIVVPVVVTGAALCLAFGRVGLNGTLRGLVLGHTVLALPFVVLAVIASLREFDPGLLRAALSLGASPLTAFRRVVLPLIRPGIATGALLAFAISFDELIVAEFVAGPTQFTLPRRMLAGLRDAPTPIICAAAVLLTAVSLLLFGANVVLRSRRTRA